MLIIMVYCSAFCEIFALATIEFLEKLICTKLINSKGINQDKTL